MERKLKGYERPTEAFLKAHSKALSSDTAKEKNSSPDTDSKKKVHHSGIKLIVNRKKTTVRPFSFDSNTKKEKGASSPAKQKPSEKSASIDEKCSADSGSQKKAVNDTLKISSSNENKRKEKSPVKEKVVESVIHKISSPKTPCSRCSKATKLLLGTAGCSKETCPESVKSPKPLKTVKSEAHSLKASKIQTFQSSKTTKIESQCSKIRRIEVTKTSVQVSNVSKTKSSSISSVKAEANLKDNKNHQLNKCNIEKSDCEFSKPRLDATNTEKAGSANGEKSEFVCSTREMAECSAPTTKDVESDASNAEKIELVNGGTPECEHAVRADAEFKLFNGTSSESEIPNGIQNDLNSTKNASKIPRITSVCPSGVKCTPKREADPESFSSENRCPNMEKRQTNNEDSVLVN